MKGFKVGEEVIMQAVHSFKEGFYHSTQAAAENYSVKPHIIQQCLQGNGSLHGHPNLNRMLNKAQEQALLNYVTYFNKIDMSSTAKML